MVKFIDDRCPNVHLLSGLAVRRVLGAPCKSPRCHVKAARWRHGVNDVICLDSTLEKIA